MTRPACVHLILGLLAGCAFALDAANPGQSPAAPERAVRPSKFIRIEDGGTIDEANVRTARETSSHSTETPNWTNAPGFERDVFTFARLIFQSDPGPSPRRGFGPRLGWWVDYPDADLNLSWRLQQLTSLRTDPDGRVLKLTDPDLHDFPLLYMEHGGYMNLSGEEVIRMRHYLQSGGAMFVNDFWSTLEWEGFAGQIARVLPDRAWVELTTNHPLFHCVYDLRRPMHQLRVPTLQLWDQNFEPSDPESTPHRVDRGEGSVAMTVRALFDERNRLLMVAVHNSDLSDGWEREGESDVFFDRFSERTAYPLAVNLLFYLMTH
ncbi:MAG: DUF4159 domain-containing protein [Verrucomicrobiales bacterium]|nr:DUF4159 domain-containing protein [Verrucomicrobiales bacterium]